MCPRVASLLLAGFLAAAPRGQAAADKVDFARDIQPIISTRCYHCHGPDEGSRKAKLRLDRREDAIKPRSDGSVPIKPGDLAASELVRRISATDPDEVMPPPDEKHPLKPAEIILLKRWVAEGAPYAGHWAFLPATHPALPKVKAQTWPRNGLDYFILAKLEQQGLKPAPPADAHALVRRVSLDLLGLPPSPEEVAAFAKEPSLDAYEKLVDRLLASPRFGERWARMWLDIARYADSAGYGSDPLRPNIWPYRDWVINAFNRNVPYDRFSLEQLAGDLLEHPTEEQLVATAFHRNTMTNTEGGTDDEEWRVAAVKDRLGVTAQAWMGLTLHCAQCHSHKFDPISQKEYYQFFALFNQTEDNDQPDERPTLPLYGPAEKQKRQTLSNQIAALEARRNENTPELLAELAAWEQSRAAGEHWVPLPPVSFSSEKGTGLVLLEDGSLLATNSLQSRDTYIIKTRTPTNHLTAVRLEVLPHETLPQMGPGQAGGNFVLTELTASFVPDAARPIKGRFVRLELPGKDRMLSLAEVEAFSGGSNVALRAQATQSSTDYAGPPALAVDGNTDGRYEPAKSTTHTRQETDPWWEVDLGRAHTLERVVVWNRTDNNLGERLNGVKVLVLDEERVHTFETQIVQAPKTNAPISLDGSRVLSFTAASADYSQKDFAVAASIDGSDGNKAGWAVGSKTGEPHLAVFETSGSSEQGELVFRLQQNYGEKHLLGRFRLFATDAQRPVRHLAPQLESILKMPATERSSEQTNELRNWFREHARATRQLTEQIAKLRNDLNQVKSVPVPVMRELASTKQRTTRLLNKGNFLDPSEIVSPASPGAFGPWPQGAPTNRLGVVQWLFSPDNPLTARVAVNRFWSQIFGTGLVETEEDFGTQGQMPSHPELLDWLAWQFRHGVEDRPSSPRPDSQRQPPVAWDMKAFLKLIVTSAAYQQSSRVTPESQSRDPKNRFLSHYPRRRLDAEMVRDQALALSGLLSPKLGGASVYPPQPPGLWKAAFNGERTYETSKGEDRYRRGLYTVWRRTIPYPSMATFDAPSRETCTLRRLPTNTPLQAYVTLNDPVFVECAQALARRLIREAGPQPADRVRHGLQLVLSRPAQQKQVAALLKLYTSEREHYGLHEADARKLATEPIGELPEGLSPAEAAAWTVVANVLLNLDGVLTKG